MTAEIATQRQEPAFSKKKHAAHFHVSSKAGSSSRGTRGCACSARVIVGSLFPSFHVQSRRAGCQKATIALAYPNTRQQRSAEARLRSAPRGTRPDHGGPPTHTTVTQTDVLSPNLNSWGGPVPGSIHDSIHDSNYPPPYCQQTAQARRMVVHTTLLSPPLYCWRGQQRSSPPSAPPPPAGGGRQLNTTLASSTVSPCRSAAARAASSRPCQSAPDREVRARHSPEPRTRRPESAQSHRTHRRLTNKENAPA